MDIDELFRSTVLSAQCNTGTDKSPIVGIYCENPIKFFFEPMLEDFIFQPYMKQQFFWQNENSFLFLYKRFEKDWFFPQPMKVIIDFRPVILSAVQITEYPFFDIYFFINW